jgi:hypothetical protein
VTNKQEQIDIDGAYQLRVSAIDGQLSVRILEYSQDRTQVFFVTPSMAIDSHVLEDGDDIHLRFGPYTVESRGETLRVNKEGGPSAAKSALSLWRAVERLEHSIAA